VLQLSFVNFRKGSYIFVEGKAGGDKFYIIQNGKVRSYKELEIGDDVAVTYGPGDFIGVIPCMSGHSQIETVVALTDVVAIAVRRDQYPALIAKNTPVAMKIIRTFANRMRILNETLTKVTLKNNIISSPEQLFVIAQYYEKVGQPNLAIYGYYQYIKACSQGYDVEKAKQRFVALKPRTNAVYFEPTNDLMRSYPKNTMIFSECQNGQEMFIIQEGQVKISKVVDGNEVILAVLKKGDFFGEMALLENKPRSASAIAHEDCKLMVVNRQNFEKLVSSQPQLIASLTTTLSERLWAMSRQLANTQIRDPLFKLFDMLSLQLEKARVVVTSGTAYQFDITPYDLANMCGIPQEEQGSLLATFVKDSRIKLVNNKIFVPDCYEITKIGPLYR